MSVFDTHDFFISYNFFMIAGLWIGYSQGEISIS